MGNTLLPILFFVTALVYSMAGLGGGSTYLALLALFSFSHTTTPQIALTCNLIVVVSGFWFFKKSGYFSLQKILPFIVSSIPMAYWGGSLHVGKTTFSLLLGVSLMIAALRMIMSQNNPKVSQSLSLKKIWFIGIPLGALLGFVSGLVGVGGGIYLTPILLLLGWANSKEAAAASSFFILVNSLSGLAGQFVKSGSIFHEPSTSQITYWLLIFSCFLGGQIGSRIGSQKFSILTLQRLSATLLLYASGRLLYSLL